MAINCRMLGGTIVLKFWPYKMPFLCALTPIAGWMTELPLKSVFFFPAGYTTRPSRSAQAKPDMIVGSLQ